MELAVVINLTVEGNPDGLIFVRQRLVPAGKVNNAQPPVAEAELPVNVPAFVIGAAMHHRVRCALQRSAIGGRLRAEIEYSADAAHRRWTVVSCRSSVQN